MRDVNLGQDALLESIDSQMYAELAAWCVCCELGIVSIILTIKARSKYCQDLNKQLAMYRAFRNIHGAAAVTRQLQLAVCPINS